MFASNQNLIEAKRVKINLDSGLKTDVKVWRPLQSFTIYLDIINCSIISQKLTEEIVQLGGTVETFLNKDVKYLVTNRRNWKLNFKDSSCENSLVCTPSSLNSASRSSTMTADSPWTGDSSTSKIINRTVKSRADTLLERANKSVKYAEDVLQMASRWGIKILHLSQFSIWLKKLKSKSKPEATPSAKMVGKEISKLKLCTSSMRTKLTPPFLKFEDVNGQYCPQLHQFQAWPSMDLVSSHDQSPFRRISSNKYLKGLGQNKQSPVVLSPGIQSSKLSKINRTAHSKQSPTCSLGNKPGYCDICCVRYSNIYEHIESSKHQEIVSEPSFYAKLDKFISTLPTLKQLQKKYCVPTGVENSFYRSPLPVLEKSNVKEGVLNLSCDQTKSPRILLKTPQRDIEGDNGTARKKQRLEIDGKEAMSQLQFAGFGKNDVEEKENALETELAKSMQTPEKKQFYVKRWALQQIQNATFCNIDNVINEQQSNTKGEGETLCLEMKTPTRLLRSTSQRRSLSCNTVGECSANSPTAVIQDRRDSGHARPLDFTAETAHGIMSVTPCVGDTTGDYSPWDQLPPLNLSAKLFAEELADVSGCENVESFTNQYHLADTNRNLTPQQLVKESNLKPLENEPDDFQKYAFSADLSQLIKEDDSWETSVDSFITSKVNRLLSDNDPSYSCASILTG